MKLLTDMMLYLQDFNVIHKQLKLSKRQCEFSSLNLRKELISKRGKL